MASGIGEVFLDPLLDQNRTEGTSKAKYQAECPQNIHGDVQVAGTSRQDIRNGGERGVGRLAELLRYLAEQQFCRIWSETTDGLG